MAMIAGVVLAISSAWRGGWFDTRCLDRARHACSPSPACCWRSSLLRCSAPGCSAASIALAIAYTPYIARVLRSAAVRERSQAYIAALEVQGCVCLARLPPPPGAQRRSADRGPGDDPVRVRHGRPGRDLVRRARRAATAAGLGRDGGRRENPACSRAIRPSRCPPACASSLSLSRSTCWASGSPSEPKRGTDPMTELHYLSATEAIDQVPQPRAVAGRAGGGGDRARRVGRGDGQRASATPTTTRALEQAKQAEARYAKRPDERRGRSRASRSALKDEVEVAGEPATHGVADATATTSPSRPDRVAERILEAGGIIHAPHDHAGVLLRRRSPTPACTASRGTRGTSSTAWAARRAAPARRWRPGTSTLASAVRTSAARSASRARSTASSASSRRTAGCRSRLPFNMDTYCHNGPMARTVADCALFENALAGPHRLGPSPRCGPSWRSRPARRHRGHADRLLRRPRRLAGRPRGRREHPGDAAESLREAGAIVEQVDLKVDRDLLMTGDQHPLPDDVRCLDRPDRRGAPRPAERLRASSSPRWPKRTSGDDAMLDGHEFEAQIWEPPSVRSRDATTRSIIPTVAHARPRSPATATSATGWTVGGVDLLETTSTRSSRRCSTSPAAARSSTCRRASPTTACPPASRSWRARTTTSPRSASVRRWSGSPRGGTATRCRVHRAPTAMTSLLSVDGLDRAAPRGGGAAHGAARRLVVDRHRRGARTRGRVRVGQVDDRARHRAAAAPRRAGRRPDRVRRSVDRWSLRGGALRRYRDRGIAMIFQDPRAHTNPVRRIGDFMTEAMRDQGRLAPRPSAQARRACSRAGRDRGPRAAALSSIRTSCRGGMLQRMMIAADAADAAAADPGRRADHGAGRHHAGRGDGDPRRAAARARPGDAVHHPRPRARRRGVRPHRGDVRRRDRRGAARPAALHDDPLHPYTAALVAARPSVDGTAAAPAAIPGRPMSAFEAPTGCAFATALRACRPGSLPATPRPRSGTLPATARCRRARSCAGTPVGGLAMAEPHA